MVLATARRKSNDKGRPPSQKRCLEGALVMLKLDSTAHARTAARTEERLR
jgi:hypothetical protein